ncbi:MAG: hypothetical protein QOJ27_326 [Sphingomonadales bacterium]|nr:hypothetical protein [Sphingomonadales bacterium]
MTGSDDAFVRRFRSQRRLEAESLPIDAGPALLPGVDEVRLPGVEEVVVRAICLTLVAAEATEIDRGLLDRLIEEYRPPFSFMERRFIEEGTDDWVSIVNLGWRFETALPLFWAAGLVETLARPEGQTEPFELLMAFVPWRREELLARAALRPAAELLDAADLHFCYDEAFRAARREGRTPPEGLHRGVVMERRRGFSWLVEGGGDWDAVVARR